MMHLYFDPDFDGGSWPGPLRDREAVAGEAWVGSLGLLGILETQLGLRGPGTSSVQRVAQLLPRVRKQEGFWSASAQKDALATARRLVWMRDELALAGWTGSGGTPMLEQLAAVTAALEPGLAERLRAVCERLGSSPCDLERVDSFVDPLALPTLWRELFVALGERGTEVRVLPLGGAPEMGGDLSASRRTDFTPAGDGSLQLIRGAGVLQAADDLAAYLATLTEIERSQTLVLGADAVLDRALRSQGLPTLGGEARVREAPLLQILPLTLALAWAPPDPQRALELLTLPQTPVPAAVRFRLARALHETPAVDSDAWRRALSKGLESVGDEAREAVTERLDLLFHRPQKGSALATGRVTERVQMLAKWARGRAAHDENTGPWEDLQHQLATFALLVEASGQAELRAPQLERFVEEATSAIPTGAPHPHQAGFSQVGTPGAVCGPCERIVWWSFELSSAPRPARLPFGPAELATLASQGVTLQSASARATWTSRRWTRPLAMATKALILICPRLGEDGEALFPHPLFDEVLARVPREQRGLAEQALIHERPRTTREVQTSTPTLLPAPVPQRAWSLGGLPVARREVESPSSAGALLGCSLQWVLQYVAKLQSGALGNLRTAEQILGETAHALLAEVLKSKSAKSPEDAEAEALRLFDEDGPRFAAQLFQPGADAERADARRVTGQAARELFRLIARGGFEVHAVEEAFRGDALGGTLEGRMDLVLARGEERAVVDLKWSGLKYRRESLEHGAAHQLAMYSHLLRNGAGTLPANAYFILRSQRLLTTDGTAFPGAQVVEGPSPEETWNGFAHSHAERWKALQEGNVVASGVEPDPELPEHSTLMEGAMHLEPPCGFCSFAAICGRAFEGGAA
jgi:hypothetical protein